VRPRDGHVRLMQLAAHTTSRDFLAVSTGALEVFLKYLRRIINARLLIAPASTTYCNELFHQLIFQPESH